jgi:hypothetical protein
MVMCRLDRGRGCSIDGAYGLALYVDIDADVFGCVIGVFMMASASQIWRATGGRFNSSFFQYKIGGEW